MPWWIRSPPSSTSSLVSGLQLLSWLRLRYREQLDKDVALQNVYKQYIKS